MVQEYLPAVRAGDKRVLLLEGTILGAINRVARDDDVRSNIHAGGRVEPCEVTAEERAIVSDMAPRLAADGLVFVGLDFIGGQADGGQRHVAHRHPGAQPARRSGTWPPTSSPGSSAASATTGPLHSIPPG